MKKLKLSLNINSKEKSNDISMFYQLKQLEVLHLYPKYIKKIKEDQFKILKTELVKLKESNINF